MRWLLLFGLLAFATSFRLPFARTSLETKSLQLASKGQRSSVDLGASSTSLFLLQRGDEKGERRSSKRRGVGRVRLTLPVGLSTSGRTSPLALGLGSVGHSRHSSSSSLFFKTSASDDLDVDEDLDLDFEELEDQGRGGGGSLLRKISKGMPVIAASLGFAATPSSALALRLAGAAVGGVAGAVARRVILDRLPEEDHGDDDRDGDKDKNGGSGRPSSQAIADALAMLEGGPPITGKGLKQLEQVAKKAGVAADELAEYFTFVFADVVYAAVTAELADGEAADLTLLQDVIDFAATVQVNTHTHTDAYTRAHTHSHTHIHTLSKMHLL